MDKCEDDAKRLFGNSEGEEIFKSLNFFLTLYFVKTKKNRVLQNFIELTLDLKTNLDTYIVIFIRYISSL